MIKRTLLMAALAVPAALPAQAQAPAEARIAAARQQASEAGIPLSLLDSKIAEGRAKDISADGIATAIERRLGSLVRARSVMATDPALRLSPADLKVGADALEAGVDEPTLSSLAKSTPGQYRAVAVAVFTQLVQQGEPPAQALQQVRMAVGKSPAALQHLPAQAAARARSGQKHAGGPPAQTGRPTFVGPPGRGRGGPPAAVPAAGQEAGANRPPPPGRSKNKQP